ncbi:hypothetical protein G9272_26300 [Streptomyces asoensis]|uniref:Uncharacterized protein n=1 Tax=Streptomyces asoensis TaxID=249586 RepID=A0A6M4WZD7_9ACTN|nr:hypothetical protein [Streptomyces asoensis]QJT03356.1 hypothetical protein G9272_26300 [Streptomyces asoensis]
MTERTPTWQELLDTAVEKPTPPAFRAALNGLRADGFSYDRLVDIADEIIKDGIVADKKFPGFEGIENGPSKGTWLNALTTKGRKAAALPDWKYVELLVVAYCKHHVLGEETRDDLVIRWADGYTVCGGLPRPKYRRTTTPPSVETPAARRKRVPYALGAAATVVVLAVSSTYFLWDPNPDPEPPLSVDDVSFLGLSTGDYVFPSTIKLSSPQVEKLKNEDYGKGMTFDDWFTQNKGVPAHFRTVSLTVSGRSKKEIRITNMDIQKQDCAPPLSGTLFLNGGTNGGETETRTLFFNLDERVPEPTLDNEPYFARHSITLKHGESETIVAFISANERSCGFTFRFTVVVPGQKPVKQEVSENGKPFQLTALAADYEGPHPYAGYRAMYVGGVAAPVGAGIVPADPSTYDGDPQSLATP